MGALYILCYKMYRWWDLSQTLSILLGVVALSVKCCPPAPPPELPPQLFSCGRHGTGHGQAANREDGHRIVNGAEAVPHSIPWQAALVSFWSGGKPFCGGTIISPWHVLTAVHCAWVPHAHVVVGEHNIMTENDNSIAHEIDCKYSHWDFNVTGLIENDFAIITLKEPLDLSTPYVKAVCLPDPELSFGSTDVFTISGWGVMEEKDNYTTSDLSETLQVAQVPWFETELCNDYYEQVVNSTADEGRVIGDSMLCAGPTDGTVDNCLGDGGGPMTWKEPSNPSNEVLAGIVSYHLGCGRLNLPGIYAKATSALEFVKRWGVDQDLGEARNKCPPCSGIWCILG